MSDTTETHPFDPIVFKDTHTLILGSFPSIQSVANDFYYAHPRNQFWPILSRITGYPVGNRDQKIWLLKESGLGVWDMIASCAREDSLDSSLEDEVVNDIPALLETYPAITRVAFTGRKAEALWRMHFEYIDIETIYLLSPSPAYAKISIEAKIAKWQELLGFERSVK
jgi:hypoxanthine-DNA glycosylase